MHVNLHLIKHHDAEPFSDRSVAQVSLQHGGIGVSAALAHGELTQSRIDGGGRRQGQPRLTQEVILSMGHRVMPPAPLHIINRNTLRPRRSMFPEASTKTTSPASGSEWARLMSPVTAAITVCNMSTVLRCAARYSKQSRLTTHK